MATNQINVLLRVKDELSAKLDAVSKKTDGMGAAFERNRRKIGLSLTAIGGAVTGVALLSVRAASNLEESMNAVEVVFKDGADVIKEFAKTSSTSVGLSRASFQQLASTTGALLKDVGLPMQEVAGLTTDLTVRAADMASVMNTSVEDALSAVGQALRGETEAIRRYAIDVTEASLETFRLSQGIEKSVQEMDQQEKKLLRVAMIMESSKDMAGDFANTQESLANQTRIMTAEIADVSAEIGTALVPIMKEILDVIRPLITNLANWIKENKETAKTIIVITAAVGALALAMGVVLLILPGLVTSFKLLAGAIKLVSLAVKANPIGLLATALSLLAIVLLPKLSKQWESTFGVIWEVTKSIGAGIKEVLGAVLAPFQGIFTAIFESIKFALNLIPESLKKTNPTLKELDKNIKDNTKTGKAFGTELVSTQRKLKDTTAATAELSSEVQRQGEVLYDFTDNYISLAEQRVRASLDAERQMKVSMFNILSLDAERVVMEELNTEKSRNLQRQRIAGLVKETDAWIGFTAESKKAFDKHAHDVGVWAEHEALTLGEMEDQRTAALIHRLESYNELEQHIREHTYGVIKTMSGMYVSLEALADDHIKEEEKDIQDRLTLIAQHADAFTESLANQKNTFIQLQQDMTASVEHEALARMDAHMGEMAGFERMVDDYIRQEKRRREETAKINAWVTGDFEDETGMTQDEFADKNKAAADAKAEAAAAAAAAAAKDPVREMLKQAGISQKTLNDAKQSIQFHVGSQGLANTSAASIDSEAFQRKAAEIASQQPPGIREAYEALAQGVDRYASGGVSGGGLALVGERGPEIVNLPGGSRVHRSGSGPGGNTFIFNGAVYGIDDLKRVVVEAVRDHALAGGFTGVFSEE